MIAENFGGKIKEKLNNIENINKAETISIDGNLPLIAKLLPINSARLFAELPRVEKEKCTLCGICISSCPTGAIKNN